MAASTKKKAIQDPAIIEGLAIFKGLQLAVPLGLSHLEGESNCQWVANELIQSEASLSSLGNILHDIKALMVGF